MSLKKKILILLGCVFLLLLVLTTPLRNFGLFHTEYSQPPLSGETLSLSSMNDFLTVWSQFIKKDVSLMQFSLAGTSSDEKYPARLSRWLRSQGWNAEHFFYMEQRLRDCLTAVRLEQTIESNKAILRKMREDAAAENLQKIITMQKAQLAAVRVTPAEIALVKANLSQITQILEGKAVLEP